MVRLKDVAERAGVSIMTVSKVLRDASDISLRTKDRVRRLAEEMGYVPDPMARSLRTRTTKLLGALVPAMTSPILGPTLAAIEDRLRERGYDLLVAQSGADPDQEAACLRRLLARRVDGLFIAPLYRLAPTAAIFAQLRRAATPVVLLGPAAPFCEGFVAIESDDLPAAVVATRHLIELKHRRIAFFAGPPAAPWAQARFQGYRRALREASIPEDESLVFAAGSGLEDGQRAALQLLNERPQASAILAANDLVAMGAAAVLLDQGMKIPEEISVAGFGNIPLSEHFRVPLTTLSQPKHRLGLAAAEAMLDLLRGGKPKLRTLVGELLVRASTGPVPKSMR